MVASIITSPFYAIGQTASATWEGTSNFNAAIAGNLSATAATVNDANGFSTSNNGLTSTGWPWFAISNSVYYQFQVAPAAGGVFTFTGINFLRSCNGIGSWDATVYYSTDNFATRTQIGNTLSVGTTESTFSQNNLSVAVPSGSTLSIRVYAAGGSLFLSRIFRVRNMVVSGTACSGPIISTQPSGGSFCSGSTLTLSASANGTSYQWKKDNANISGATSATYIKNNITIADAGSYTVVVGNSCSSATSEAAVVSVSTAPTSVAANVSATAICAGQSLNLTATANSGSPTGVTLLSENFNSASNNWTKTNTGSGGTPSNAAWTLRSNYEPQGFSGMIKSDDESQFYFSNSDSQNGGTTRTTLVSPAFSTVGLNSANLNFHHYFKVNTWAETASVEVSTNGTNWTSVATYTTTQGSAQDFSNVNIALPGVLNQPTVYVRFNYTASNGRYWAIDNVTINGALANVPATYSWTSVPAGFTSALQNPVVHPMVNTVYTVSVTNTYGCSVSASTPMVAVNPAAVGGNVAGTTTVCATSNSGTLTLTGYVGSIIRWESSLDNFATAGIHIANTSATLSYSDLAATTSYRAVIRSGSCSVANSSVATVAVSSPNIAGTLAGTTAHCSHVNSGTLTLSGYAGTTLNWEYSLDNFATAGIAVANNAASFSYANLEATTYFRVIVGNGVGCASVKTNVVTISIDDNSTWTGGTNTSWNEPTNWSCSEVPQSYTNVIIAPASNQPVITADAFAKTLTLQAGTLLSLLSNDLTVTDAIASGGSFTIANNANLIQINDVANTGVVKVKRNSSALMRQDYTLWSSPVDGQDLLAFSPQTLTNRFYTYNNANNQYAAVSNPNATAFAEGTSYLIRMPNNHAATPTVWNGEFNGVLRNGEVNVALNNAGEGYRFNALGNPYPSPIDMTAFVNDNAAHITGTIYFWRKTNNPISPSYCTWTAGGGFVTNGETQTANPNSVVRTGQGFIVEASATGTQAVFNNAQRSGNNGNQFFRQAAEIERHRIWLNASTAQGAFCQTLVGYIEGSTMENDPQIDGRFFNDGEISFYSLISDMRFAIQGRPIPFNDNDIVPMGFKATTAGTFSISIAETDGLFLEGQDIFLRDNLTNAVHDLHSGAYSFASEAGTFNSRFEIVYQNALGTNDPVVNADAVVVYKQQQRFVINSGNVEMKSVKVYDVLGKLIRTVGDVNASEVSFSVSGASQMLVFRIMTADNMEVIRKVMN